MGKYARTYLHTDARVHFVLLQRGVAAARRLHLCRTIRGEEQQDAFASLHTLFHRFRTPAKAASLFLSALLYVCPEPVLVKWWYFNV